MGINILTYLTTVNLIIFGLLYRFFNKVNILKKDLDEYALHLYSIQEAIKGETEEDDSGTGD